MLHSCAFSGGQLAHTSTSGSVKDTVQREGNFVSDLSPSHTAPRAAFASKMQTARLLEGNSHEAAVLNTHTTALQ